MATVNLFRNATNFEIVPPGHVIMEEGDTGEQMYVVLDGSVDIIIDGEVFETVYEGGIFGEMALIDDAPRSASVVARTYCKIVPVGRQQFDFMVQQTPHFATNVMAIMAERIRRMNTVSFLN